MPISPTLTTYEAHRDILASSNWVAASYTIDSQYVAAVTLADGTTKEMLWEGQMMALNPVGQKVVPNYASYGFAALGPIMSPADLSNGDTEHAVLFRGDVKEDFITDDGVFGTVLSATKNTLADRIQFVTEDRL